MKYPHLRRRVVDRIRQIDGHGHDVLGVEAGINGAQTQKALDHQTCADQQHQRRRYFEDDESAANEVASPAFGRTAPGIFQRLIEVRL